MMGARDTDGSEITISGPLAEKIQSGEAVNIGLLVYDVAEDKLKVVGFIPEAGAVLDKFNIRTQKVDDR
jgi:hypothetical protein